MATTVAEVVICTAAILVLLRLLRPVLNPALLSPVRVAVLVYLTLGVLGLALYDLVASNGGTSVELRLDADERRQTFFIFVIVAASILAGAAWFTVVRRPTPPRELLRNARLSPSSGVPPRSQRRLLTLASLPLALVAIDNGISPILSRSEYLMERGPLAGLGVTLATATTIVIGYLIAAGAPAIRRCAIALGTVHGALFLAVGSRRLALFPVLLAVGVFAARMDRRSLLRLAAAVGSSFLLLGLPLHLRGQERHGFAPYVGGLVEYASQQPPWETLAANVLVSFPLAGEVATNEPPLPLGDLAISLNPLPGRMTSWYEVADRHRLNAYTPYSTLGEGANYGLPSLVVLFVGVGIELAYLEARIRRWIAASNPFVGLGILGLSSLFVITTLQYPTRSSVRLLLYGVAVDVAARLFVRLRSSHKWRTARSCPILPADP